MSKNGFRLNNRIVEFIFISVLGVLSHFAYEWSGNNRIVGMFCATNESTFEHLKLIFFPMLLLTIIEYFLYYRQDSTFLGNRFLAILCGMAFTVVAFYTSWGIIGKIIDPLNIAIYLIAIMVALKVDKKRENATTSINNHYALIGFIIFTIMFLLFTNNPPKLGIFYDLAKHPKKL